MKKTILIIALMLASTFAFAERPFLRFGIEWGYGANFYKYWNYNYIDSKLSYRIWDEDSEFLFRQNAYALVMGGADIIRWLNVSLFTGTMGISRERQVIPFGARVTAYPKGTENNGPMVAIGSGIGFSDYFSGPTICFVSLAGGYRFVLSTLWDIDFVGKVRFCSDHPKLWDAANQEYVKTSDIRRNIAAYCSFEFGAALSF